MVEVLFEKNESRNPLNLQTKILNYAINSFNSEMINNLIILITKSVSFLKMNPIIPIDGTNFSTVNICLY